MTIFTQALPDSQLLFMTISNMLYVRNFSYCRSSHVILLFFFVVCFLMEIFHLFLGFFFLLFFFLVLLIFFVVFCVGFLGLIFFYLVLRTWFLFVFSLAVSQAGSGLIGESQMCSAQDEFWVAFSCSVFLIHLSLVGSWRRIDATSSSQGDIVLGRLGNKCIYGRLY